MGKRARKRLPKPPRMVFPKGIVRDYERSLLGLVRIIQETVDQKLIPHLETLTIEAGMLRPDSTERFDDWNVSLDRLIELVQTHLNEEFVITIALAQDIAQKVSQWNDKQWQKVTQTVLGSKLIQREPWLPETLNAFVKDNVALITSIKDDSVREIEGMVRRAVQGGIRHESIAKQIRERYGVIRRRARLIARDQVAKLNGNLTMLRQKNIGIKKYIWWTSGDRRVRPTHRSNEGKIFSWDDPPETGHPGQDVQCRCTAEAIFEDEFREIAA